MATTERTPLGGLWTTWSPEARRLLQDLTDVTDCLPEPALVRFGDGEYDYTLDLSRTERLGPNLAARLAAFGRGLHRLATPSPILFSNLLGPNISRPALRVALAGARTTIVQLTGDQRSAIYAPLGIVGETEQEEFPLHADLYPPALLLNVFDDVPDDDSGASIFLPAAKLTRAVGELLDMPNLVKREIADCLTRSASEDRYERFYDLLHGDHPWTERLEHTMEANCVTVRLCRGEGYLIHDRYWLHGRTAPTGGVPRDRLHRLIFDNESTFAERKRDVR